MNLRERNENMRNFFNKKIDSYDDTHEKFMNTKRAMIDYLTRPVNKVLDLGVGTGLELIHFFEVFPNAQVDAIDITENMLAKLKERKFIDKVSIICGDFFKVDFANNYDAVISTSTLHHFLYNDKLILYKKIYNSLKENGEFINADKIALNKEDELKGIDDYYQYKDELPHIDTPLSLESEIKLLKEVGFKDILVLDADVSNYKIIKAIK